MSRGPAHVVRFGLIKACIWANTSKDGTRFSVTVNRLFKNGDQWKEPSRFGRDDLLLVAKVVNEAHSWIYEQNTRAATHEVNGAPK